MKKYIIFFICILAITLVACKSHQTVSTATYHNYTTECMGKSMDGSQTLRVWATGRNRADAIEQAKKKAVYDVTFTGINAGGGECNAYPVVDEANARKKYEEYFDKFFADGGDYGNYVNINGQKTSAMGKFQGDGNQMYGIIVTVNRSALRERFINDNIIIK